MYISTIYASMRKWKNFRQNDRNSNPNSEQTLELNVFRWYVYNTTSAMWSCCILNEFQVMDPLTASKGLKRDTKGNKGRKPNSFIASFLRWMESQSTNGRQLSRPGESITGNISYKWKYNWIPEHKLDFLSFIWWCQQWRESRWYTRLFGG